MTTALRARQHTVKLSRQQPSPAVLQPENPAFEPLEMPAEEVRVIAEVVEVVGG